MMVGESVEQNLNDIKISTSPNGEEFILPGEADYRAENERLAVLVREHKELGREIVVVMGVGFVGAVMAGVVADSCDRETEPYLETEDINNYFQTKPTTVGNKATVIQKTLEVFYGDENFCTPGIIEEFCYLV